MQELSAYLSANAHNMKKSVIRELLKLTNQPDIISFAGGLPAPETFSVEELRQASDESSGNMATRSSNMARQKATTTSRHSSSRTRRRGVSLSARRIFS